MVNGRQDHANLKNKSFDIGSTATNCNTDLETHQQSSDYYLIDCTRMHLQQHNIRVGQTDEQETSKDVAPDVDGFVRPPEHTLQAELGGQNGSVPSADEWIELQVLRCIFVAKQLSQFVVRDILFTADQFCWTVTIVVVRIGETITTTTAGTFLCATAFALRVGLLSENSG